MRKCSPNRCHCLWARISFLFLYYLNPGWGRHLFVLKGQWTFPKYSVRLKKFRLEPFKMNLWEWDSKSLARLLSSSRWLQTYSSLPLDWLQRRGSVSHAIVGTVPHECLHCWISAGVSLSPAAAGWLPACLSATEHSSLCEELKIHG